MKSIIKFVANVIIFACVALTVMAITDRAQNAGWLQKTPVTTACAYVVNAVGEKFDENYVEETYRWIHMTGEEASVENVELN